VAFVVREYECRFECRSESISRFFMASSGDSSDPRGYCRPEEGISVARALGGNTPIDDGVNSAS
jgi:hypothetical protein